MVMVMSSFGLTWDLKSFGCELFTMAGFVFPGLLSAIFNSYGYGYGPSM